MIIPENTSRTKQKNTKIACLHCDLLLTSVPLSAGEDAICPRCNQLLYYGKKSFQNSIALLLTALIIYFPAVSLPFLSMQTAGQSQQISLLTSLSTIATGSNLILAMIVFLLVLLLPLVKFLGLLSIIYPLSKRQRPQLGFTLTRLILRFSPWSMAEVYLIGVLVTLVKLASMADIHFLGGFYAFALLIIIDALVSITIPKRRIWNTVHEIEKGHFHGYHHE